MAPDRTLLHELRVLADYAGQSCCSGCDGCGTRCVAGFQISRREFEEITNFLHGPEGARARESETAVHEHPYPGDVDDTGATFRSCRFRDNERQNCSIYPVRPLICRLFGHVEWLPCPIGLIPEPLPEGPAIMLRYAGLELRTYEEWLSSAPPTGDVPF